jgi:hypothetical protein
MILDGLSPRAKNRFLILFFSCFLLWMIFGGDIEYWLAGLKGRSP